jgi:hypothetical protein
MDVFTSRCNNAKMMVTTRKQCARARDVHESGKTSKSLGAGAERGARSSQEFQNAKNDGKRYERKGE